MEKPTFLIGPNGGKISINEKGYWEGPGAEREHYFDAGLADALAEFFLNENALDIVDLGCGKADYVKALRLYAFHCQGYDGNPDTPRLSKGIAQVADLSVPVDLGRKYDWVLSLEVGEHLPQKFEKIFIENLIRHNKKGIVLSWAVKGQEGLGHFNEQDNDYIKAIMLSYGYANDPKAENILRKRSRLPWFKNTIMVFRD